MADTDSTPQAPDSKPQDEPKGERAPKLDAATRARLGLSGGAEPKLSHLTWDDAETVAKATGGYVEPSGVAFVVVIPDKR